MKKSILPLLLVASLCAYSQQNFTGTYGYSLKLKTNSGYDRFATGPTGNLTLLKMEGNKYRFWLDVTIGWPSYNSGETDGTITFVRDTASFDNTFEGAANSCILKFKISGTTVTISSKATSHDCGFGNNVLADGEYLKLKTQPVLNYEWLKKEYSQTPYMLVTAKKATLYPDESGLRAFPKPQYFTKGDRLLNIAETEKMVYTEMINAAGKFIYGWLKKSDVMLLDEGDGLGMVREL